MNAVEGVVGIQVNDFLELTKPRITLLVLVTTFTGMWLASNGILPLDLILPTLLGVGLAAASSGVLNHYFDREIDKHMRRTQYRALPSGRVQARQALWFGLGLGFGAFVLLFFAVNPLTAYLAIFTIVFYVIIYTLWLKRCSPLCTEIGGVAGALPPVIGWAAVSNELGLPVLILFLVMMLWQPPHFWALALLRADEYRRAGLPMLPVVRGEQVTKRRMMLYTLALVPATMSLYFLQFVGEHYLFVVICLNIAYLGITLDFIRKPLKPNLARRLFGFSILYLFVLFIITVVDYRAPVSI